MKMYLPPRGAPPSRRGVLKKGLFGGLVLALGGGGWLFTRRSAVVALPEGLQVLDAREYAVMWALVQRFAPVRVGFPSADELKTAVACDGILAMTDDTSRAEVKQLLLLFENALPNFLFGGRARPFTQLDPVTQDEVLAEWRDSRLVLRRTGYLALRGLALAAYYGNPGVWAAVGYGGPPAGIYDPAAPVWKGGGEPRPFSNGQYVEPAPAAPDQGGTP